MARRPRGWLHRHRIVQVAGGIVGLLLTPYGVILGLVWLSDHFDIDKVIAVIPSWVWFVLTAVVAYQFGRRVGREEMRQENEPDMGSSRRW